MKHHSFFDSVHVVNLQRRTQRIADFMDRFSPFHLPWEWHVETAIDGNQVTAPSWWGAGNGAWGCFRSHFRVIEMALNQNLKNVLIFEDDAVPTGLFAEKLDTCLDELPENWDFLYLGGQHQYTDKQQIIPISEHLALAYSVNRTHGVAINGKAIPTVYQHLLRRDWPTTFHIDHWMEVLHRYGGLRIFAVTPWLVGQAPGMSDISGRNEELRWFENHFTPVSADLVLEKHLHTVGDAELEVFQEPHIGVQNDAYPVETIEDGIDILYWNVGYGSLGLQGDLGYEGKRVVALVIHSGIQWISAHAPSRVVIRLQKKCSVFAAINDSGSPRSHVKSLVNGSEIGTLDISGKTTEPVILNPGIHTLVLETENNTLCHTLWGIYTLSS